jgi:rhamnose transport system permease protein
MMKDGMRKMAVAAPAVLATPEAIVVVLLPIALFVGSRLSSVFLDAEYLLDSTSLYAETGVMALAMTFVIASGNIDLSVASNLALTGVVCGKLYAMGCPMGVVIPMGCVIGAVLGGVNAMLIAGLRLPSLTVTLGTLALYRGLAQVIAGDHSISSFPGWFVGIDYRKAGMVPAPLMILLGLAVAAGLVLHRSVFGRQVYSLGTNEGAARYSGMPVARVRATVFVLSGLSAGVGAMMMLSRLGVARYDLAAGDELSVITAVVLGGTSIFGGRGTMFGTVIALLLLGVIRRAMGVSNMTPDAQLVVTGSLLIAAVLMAQGASRLNMLWRRRTRKEGT